MKNTIITIISLLVLLLVIAYGYEFIFKKPVIESPVIDESADLYLPSVELKEQYKDGTYTFVGSVEVPTPCHTLQTEVTQSIKTVYQIEVITVAPEAGIMCAQVVTNKSYKVSFVAPQDITVYTLINGIKSQTNRFLIPLDQNIDTFELEVKG